jgi:starvation-inducible DNA-binding protein
MAIKNLEKHLYPSKIDIPESTRSQVVELLNQTLAATLDLYSQVKQAHWNVKGMNFYQLHLAFDDVASAVFPFVDTLAERATSLGGNANGTVHQSANSSFLPEYPTLPINEKQHLEAVQERLALYLKHAREGIAKTDDLDDETTNDIYIEIARTLDQKLWFIEAHLQG